MKRLSIIIVTYNSEHLIFDCLDSIYKYNDIGDHLEIIIVDNCSSDQKSVFTRIQRDYPEDIILISNPENNGYGAGNNLGVKQASSDYFVVMNPDVRLVSPIFCKLLDAFESNEKLGMVGVTFVDGSKHLYFKPEYANLFRLVFSPLLIKFSLYKIEHMFFSGSFLVFKKLAFETSGCFDENIFMYHEEADISNRILKLGYEAVLNNNVSVLHLAHGRSVNLFLLNAGSVSRKYYFEKYNLNLDRYYSDYLLIYRFKYVLAMLFKREKKKNEFKAWIEMCKNKGSFDHHNLTF